MDQAIMLTDLNRNSDWSQVRVTVLGLGIAGYAAADNLTFLGAQVTAVDERDTLDLQEKKNILETLGATVILGEPLALPAVSNIVVVSPGIAPAHPVILAAIANGIPVWGELEVAWRLRDIENPAPWLCITGTNGKTTTTLMLESMLQAAGLRATAAGNIGRSLIEVVMDPDPYDVIAVEVGAPQLPFVYSMSPLAAACLNIAEDHVDHFGSMDEYVTAKAKIFARTQIAAIYNSNDETTLNMVREAEVVEGCRAVGFTLAVPMPGEFGVVEEFLVDRTFVADTRNEATELAELEDVQPAALHNVANALAAAALARAYGLEPSAIKLGLQQFTPAAHRVAHVATVNGVKYIDDSKATNAHAAQTAINSFDNVIWIAGGDAKGQDFTGLAKSVANKIKAVVLLGRDRSAIKAAMDEFAPNVLQIEISNLNPEAIDEVVAEASRIANPGDVVLLAPACASWDMYQNYSQRGDMFARAVLKLTGEKNDND
jgi:UDP-N-acetylmuramoylalanine--D-glutamate ligase